MADLEIVRLWKQANPHEDATLQGKARYEHFVKWADDLMWEFRGMLRGVMGELVDEKLKFLWEGDGRPVSFEPPMVGPEQAAQRLKP